MDMTMDDHDMNGSVPANGPGHFPELFDDVPAGLFRTTPEGKFVYVNNTAARMLGYENRESLLRKEAGGIYRYEDTRKIYVKELIQKGFLSVREVELKKKDGSFFWAEISARTNYSPQKEILGFDGYIIDITAQKKANDLLRTSEEKFRLLSENIRSAIFIFDTSGRYIYMNPASLVITGYSEEELKSKQFYEIVHPDFIDFVKKRGQARLAGKTVPVSYEFKILTKDGEERWVEVSNSMMMLEGEPVVLGTAIDVTNRKMADAFVRESEKKYKALYSLFRLMSDNVPDMIWAKDLKNRYIFANKSLCENLLCTSDTSEPIGKTDLYFAERERRKHPGDPEWHTFGKICSDSDDLVISARKAVRTDEPGRVKGEMIYLDVNKAPFWDEKGRLIGTVGSARDVTKERIIEKERKRFEELQSVAYKIAGAVITTGDLDELFPVIRNELDRVIDTTNFCIALYDQHTDEITLPYLVSGIEDEVSINDLKTLTSFLIHENKPLILKKGRMENLPLKLTGKLPEVWIGTPLKAREKVIGALMVQNYHDENILTGNDLEIIGFVSTQIGLTINQKQAEESLKESEFRLRKIIDTVPHMIFVKSWDGRFLLANQATARTYGLTVEELEGKLQKEVHKDSGEADDFLREDRYVIDHNETRFIPERKFTFHDGEVRVMQTIKIPFTFPSRGQGAVIGVSIDITNIKKVEVDLQAAKERAEESDRLKTAFLANMSHEIRTPMNAIVGFSELLNDPSLMAEHRKEYVALINENSKILLNLIEDIIDVAKIEAGQIRIVHSSCQVNRIIDELKDLFENEILRLKRKSLEIKVFKGNGNEGFSIISDPFRLRQILNNLLSNAVKFTSSGFIEYGYTIGRENTIHFFVRDTGIGLQKEKTDIIFERFRQAEESSTRGYGGTGLGLTITKKLVELLGGKIWVESEPGKGSVFHFILPFILADAVESRVERSVKTESPDWEGKTFLVAEDEQSNYELVKAILSKTRAKILYAKNGEEAVKLFRKHDESIDLVLMDIRMPEMNGFEAARIIKGIRKPVPVISLTAYAMAEDREKSILAGFDDYISKPIKPSDLINIIRKHIK
ncbi:MAG: PAS domain S-box protein [Bacteroidales bacterium]|nr:PAS domain S-box protein [Bacteroidales bacterium]